MHQQIWLSKCVVCKSSCSPDCQQWETPYETSPEENIAQCWILPQERQTSHSNHRQLHHLHHEEIKAELFADHGL